MNRECSIAGCTEIHYAFGWCNRHYLSWRRHGDPLAAKRRATGPWQHGSMTGYNNHGCRCRLCRDAIAAYHREKVKGVCPGCGGVLGNRYRSRLCQACRHASIFPEHGTTSRYARGCRCDLCRRASADARRARRHAVKAR